MTPYQALCGRVSSAIIPYTKGSTRVPSLEEQLLLRDEVLKDLKSKLLQAHYRMQQKVNRKRREVEYNVGKLVLVLIQRHRQTSVQSRPFRKLAKKYYNPFLILACVGVVVYRL